MVQIQEMLVKKIINIVDIQTGTGKLVYQTNKKQKQKRKNNPPFILFLFFLKKW